MADAAGQEKIHLSGPPTSTQMEKDLPAGGGRLLVFLPSAEELSTAFKIARLMSGAAATDRNLGKRAAGELGRRVTGGGAPPTPNAPI